jgi:hypothetical protein
VWCEPPVFHIGKILQVTSLGYRPVWKTKIIFEVQSLPGPGSGRSRQKKKSEITDEIDLIFNTAC